MPQTEKVIPTTLWILPHERALALVEENQVSPLPGMGWRRIQSIFVVRNDQPAEWRQDLGSATDFKASQFRIPAYLEHTVDELQDMAIYLRTETGRTAEDVLRSERARHSESIEDRYYDHMQSKEAAGLNRSKFGPGYSKQRNR